MRVRLETIGCRLNTGEFQDLASRLQAQGHRLVEPGEAADRCIVNTCTVTAVAGRKSRQALRQLRRAHPDAVVVATGCLAELEPDSAAGAGASHVIGSRDKDHLPEILTRAGLLPALTRPSAAPSAPSPIGGRHTRAFVKVQDGCNNRCAYCVVRLARGPGRSREVEPVIVDLRAMERRGFLEAVLTGVHLGSYGHDRGRREGLAELVSRILEETSLPRIRLSSLEPWDVTDRLLRLFASPRLLPHLHLPLQSGCDATLQRMARRTSRAEFARLVTRVRESIPGVSVSTDLMFGFPGETEEEFAESLAFVERMSFSRTHVFRFSPRPGTPAAAMPDQVPGGVTATRASRARDLARRLQGEFHRRFVGTTCDVLWEGFEAAGSGRRWNGLTPNYIRTFFEAEFPIDLANRITGTELGSVVPGGMLGTPLTP